MLNVNIRRLEEAKCRIDMYLKLKNVHFSEIDKQGQIYKDFKSYEDFQLKYDLFEIELVKKCIKEAEKGHVGLKLNPKIGFGKKVRDLSCTTDIFNIGLKHGIRINANKQVRMSDGPDTAIISW